MQVVEAQTAAPVSTRFARHYAASAESCPRARQDVAEVFSDLGMSDDGAFAASLVLTELFTNAILHHKVGGVEQVHVAIHENSEANLRWVGIGVTDAGKGAVRPPADIAPSREGFGRGLEVVRGMGARLTDVRVPGGYTVMAWIPVSDELRRRVCQCDCPSVHGRELSACCWLIEERDDWEDGVRNDSPGAHLCSACRSLIAALSAHQAAAEPTEAAAAETGTRTATALVVSGR